MLLVPREDEICKSDKQLCRNYFTTFEQILASLHHFVKFLFLFLQIIL